MTIRRLVLAIFISMLLFSSILAALVLVMHNNQQKLLASYESRYQSYLLADQLRQSSDDLTRFARTYAVTGDMRYQEYFFDVLAIRNGEKPRPQDYERIYWDLIIDSADRPRENTIAEPLKSLMKKAGFTEQELAKLKQAEDNSNTLVDIETVALNAVQGLYLDADGEYTQQRTPDLKLARELLHDDAYHHEKARIMQPLDDFFIMLDKRTQQTVEAYLQKDQILYDVLIAMAVCLFLFSIMLSLSLVRLVLKPLGGEPAVMNQIADNISSGNLDLSFNEQGSSGVYRSLQMMTQNLKKSRQESKDLAWLQEGEVSIGTTLRNEQSLSALSNSLLAVLSHYLNAQVGALYYWRDKTQDDGEGVLQRTATFAHMEVNQRNLSYQLGQGLVGQAATGNQISVIEHIPDGYMTIDSASGNSQPHHIVLMPFSHQGELRGVLELGFLQPFSDIQRKLLENIRGSIGITFENLQAKANLRRTLQESQSLSEELQTQQEELRVANQSLQENSTDLKQKTLSLEKSQQELETKASQLEKSNQYKSEFLANMSHELRTPLNSLLILSRLLADNDEGNLSAEQEESAQVIHDNGANLLELINDILDLSKIEAGHMVVNDAAINSQQLQKNIESRFAHMATDKGIAFTCEIADDIPTYFTSDPMRLEQVLNNLIGNALKFTPEGSVNISITRANTGKDSSLGHTGSLYFSVQDSGIGIPVDKQNTIFKAFQQADGSTTRQFGGTGLGLSISRELAELLGGQIELESTLGSGSTFTLVIPERSANASDPANPAPVASPNTPSRQTGQLQPHSTHPPDKPQPDDRQQLDASKPLFLIIEDDPYFARILYNCCHQKGGQALIASDGESGLALSQKFPITGIILDYMLPGMDGGQVLEQLQASEATRHIPVHIMSALNDLRDMREQGASGQLVKPISKQQITEVLSQIYSEVSDNTRLLIVEDDEAGIFALKKLLKIDGVTTDWAKTGQETLKAVRQHPYSAIVLDLTLPDMTGFEVLRTLTADNITLPPIIVHTGKELTDSELLELNHYTDKIVIKSANSAERLLEEVQIFVSRVGQSPHRNTPKEEQVAEIKLNDRTVLLVDDDMRNTFALAKALRNREIRVHVAPGGEQALELLGQHQDIELVLMDIMMPGMDGYQTTQRIREQTQHGELPIIALTANAMPGDREKCLDAGINDYLSKPVELQKLLVCMHQWL